MKGYSIITDFGCDTGCSYCIWKNHSMYGVQHNRKHWLDKVGNFIESCPDWKLSISGGGDPLNKIKKNNDFWSIIRNKCIKVGKKIDIHTSYTNWSKINFNEIINRMVLHSNCQKAEKQVNFILSQIEKFPRIRINFVITDKVEIEVLKWVEHKLGNKREVQIAYREYVGDEEKPSLKITNFCSNIENRLWNGKYVKQSDYNIYLFPNGNVYNNFLTAENEND